MKLRLFMLNACLLSLSFSSVQAFTGPAMYAVVWVKSEDSLRLRAGPATSYKILKNIPFNAIKVKNLGSRTANGWCKVQYLGVSGWSFCKYLGESSGARYYSSQGYTGSLRFYQQASSKAAVAGMLPEYATGIEGLDACVSTWCRIRYDGKLGWVQRKYLASWQF
ncbi:SH3 domain-containing protein [uncultured Thiothrix sp.]|uniref:SH3 domain-containing protein n=1 Tax=uncultured Thiothrix sp. TaxID=223185 RepID=UPI002627E100|nr:SH3 domain-containing protein [uncultured Thiothrix sp.]HMT94668.1 SH3 domain-containing protein [Thiolinea sp.]